MLRYQTIPVTDFQQNCSLVWCDQTLQAAVIDPGGDLDSLLAAVKIDGNANQLTIGLGLDACASVLGKQECGSQLTPALPIYLLQVGCPGSFLAKKN